MAFVMMKYPHEERTMEAPANQPPSAGDNTAPRAGATDISRHQKESVTRFATLLGTSSAPASSCRGHELLSLLSDSVTDNEVVLTVPSLEINDSDKNGVNLLPKVGEHRERLEESSTKSTARNPADSSQEGSRPNMAASVLTVAGAAKSASNAEKRETQQMCKQASWTKSTLRFASAAITSNISDFFGSLADSLVKSWTLCLLQHSLSTGDSESRTALLSMLSASIQVDSCQITYQTLPMPDSVDGQPKEADVILPLLFQVTLNMSIKNQKESVTGRAPGTISAHFDKSPIGADEATENNIPQKLTKVEIRVDTGVMLNSMIDQTRIVVSKAVASATKMTVSEVSPAFGGAKDLTPKVQPKPSWTSESSEPISVLKKHRSALRLNRVLKKNGGNSLKNLFPGGGLRKKPTVTWDTPGEIPTLNPSAPSPKKPRVAPAPLAKLKRSVKSFGRPHADDFGSGPRNATFGEFGGRTQFWGRNGRLAGHSRPMQAAAENQLVGNNDPPLNKNATFNLESLRERSLESSRERSRQILNNKKTRTTLESFLQLPRTATDLEISLLKSSSFK